MLYSFFDNIDVWYHTLKNNLYQWTFDLWNNYMNCYVHKTKPDLKSYPFPFRIHMYNLHQKYLKELRKMGSYISKQVVIQYVNNIEPAALMYVINFELHKETNYKNRISKE